MTTITISDALKSALEYIRDTTDGLDSLDATINHVIDQPEDRGVELDGHEKTLSETIKVHTRTKNRVKAIKEMGDFADYDAVLRDRIGARERDTGEEEPVELDPL